MTQPNSRLADYLQHILEAIGRIRRYTSQMSEAEFQTDELVQDAVIRNLEVMGEAARNIELHDAAFVTAHPELPLKDIYLMRNRLSHGYFSVDMVVVWKTVQRDLPELEANISPVYEKLMSSGSSAP